MEFEKDHIPTNSSAIDITFIGHGTLMIEYDNTVIHIDPWSKLADYLNLPAADLILITHEHPDHLDTAAVKMLKKENSQILCTQNCYGKLKKITEKIHILKNGDAIKAAGVPIRALPAYNIKMPFHPKGRGNGYVLTLDSITIYIAGDTENTPEMKNLRGIDIAFLPMNLPYTMTPEKVADAALAFHPAILYPYHFGKTDTSQLTTLLKDSEIDVRIRNMA